jgi:alpha-tubulin suppressor-like RCC1 family protein
VVGGLGFESIDVGLRTSCAVTAANQGFCWNSNSGGRPEPVAGGLSFRSIGMGGLHSCGVTPGGDAYCWGANRNGEIGDGTRQDALAPAKVVGGIAFRTAEASNGGSLNSGHSCGLSTDGIAYCWGYNGSYALGNPGVSLSAVPIAVVAP